MNTFSIPHFYRNTVNKSKFLWYLLLARVDIHTVIAFLLKSEFYSKFCWTFLNPLLQINFICDSKIKGKKTPLSSSFKGFPKKPFALKYKYLVPRSGVFVPGIYTSR